MMMEQAIEEHAARQNIRWFEQQLLEATHDRERRLLRDLLMTERERLAATVRRLEAAARTSAHGIRRLPTMDPRFKSQDMVKINLLLAEDEDTLQEMLEEVLTDAGFEVVVASDGMQAIGKLSSEPNRFGAIVTDINLGVGPDGWAVGEHARMLIPDIAVIYVSGHSVHDWPVKGVSNSLFLRKPFKLTQMAAAVSALVAASRSERNMEV